MARGGARPGAGRPARKSANTSPLSARARARARGGSENQRPWPADKVERWAIAVADRHLAGKRLKNMFPAGAAPGARGADARFAVDSPLEGDGFELPVPGREPVRRGTGLKSRKRERICSGTEGSQRGVRCELDTVVRRSTSGVIAQPSWPVRPSVLGNDASRAVTRQLGDDPRGFTALRGLMLYHLNLLELEKSQHFAEEAMHVAERLDDGARLVGAQMALGVTVLDVKAPARNPLAAGLVGSRCQGAISMNSAG
jgi:hypothetical protein